MRSTPRRFGKTFRYDAHLFDLPRMHALSFGVMSSPAPPLHFVRLQHRHLCRLPVPVVWVRVRHLLAGEARVSEASGTHLRVIIEHLEPDPALFFSFPRPFTPLPFSLSWMQVCQAPRLRRQDHRVQPGKLASHVVQWPPFAHPIVSFQSRGASLFTPIPLPPIFKPTRTRITQSTRHKGRENAGRRWRKKGWRGVRKGTISSF